MSKIDSVIAKMNDGKNPLFEELYGKDTAILKEQATRYAALMNELTSGKKKHSNGRKGMKKLTRN